MKSLGEIEAKRATISRELVDAQAGGHYATFLLAYDKALEWVIQD